MIELGYGKYLISTFFGTKSVVYQARSISPGPGDAVVSALDSEASGLGSSLGRGHCVVFLGKTFNSHSASLHPGV